MCTGRHLQADTHTHTQKLTPPVILLETLQSHCSNNMLHFQSASVPSSAGSHLHTAFIYSHMSSGWHMHVISIWLQRVAQDYINSIKWGCHNQKKVAHGDLCHFRVHFFANADVFIYTNDLQRLCATFKSIDVENRGGLFYLMSFNGNMLSSIYTSSLRHEKLS